MGHFDKTGEIHVAAHATVATVKTRHRPNSRGRVSKQIDSTDAQTGVRSGMITSREQSDRKANGRPEDDERSTCDGAGEPHDLLLHLFLRSHVHGTAAAAADAAWDSSAAAAAADAAAATEVARYRTWLLR